MQEGSDTVLARSGPWSQSLSQVRGCLLQHLYPSWHLPSIRLKEATLGKNGVGGKSGQVV